MLLWADMRAGRGHAPELGQPAKQDLAASPSFVLSCSMSWAEVGARRRITRRWGSLTQQDLAPCAPSTVTRCFFGGKRSPKIFHCLVSWPTRTACSRRRRRPPLGTWRGAPVTDSAIPHVCECTHAVLNACMLRRARAGVLWHRKGETGVEAAVVKPAVPLQSARPGPAYNHRTVGLGQASSGFR